MEDVVIIGAGPAGLTAAIYVQRAGKHAVVFEKSVPGGQIVKTLEIQNYPSIRTISGADFAGNLYQHAVDLGAEVRFEAVTGLDVSGKNKFVTTENGLVEAKAIIIATGANSRKLGLEKEDEFLGKGISYCATCDGMFFKNQTVAVVGGGNTALGDATFLSNYCNKVYLIVRSEISGEQTMVDELLQKDNVEIILNASVKKLVGKEKLEKIVVLKKSGEELSLPTSGLFVAIGQIPSNNEFKNVIKTNSFGYIEAGEDCKTNIPGVFVAGDNRAKQIRQLTTACSDGTIAALAAIEFIK